MTSAAKSLPSPPHDAAMDLLVERVADVLAGRVVAFLAARLPGPAGETPEPLLPARDLAKLLGVSRPTINRMVKLGMPCEWVNGARRFQLSACKVWKDARGRVSVTPERKPPRSKRERGEPTAVAGVRIRTRKAAR